MVTAVKERLDCTTSPQTHFRSQLFVADLAHNPLAQAATPLLSLVTRLQHTHFTALPHRFVERLVHEVKAFESRAFQVASSETWIGPLRYALCALLDQTLTHHTYGARWEEHALLTTFQQPTDLSIFFEQLQLIKSAPEMAQDVLECLYYCFSLGLSRTPAEPHALEYAELDALFALIQRDAPEPSSAPSTHTKPATPLHPWKLLLFGSSFLGLATYALDRVFTSMVWQNLDVLGQLLT